jgi:hypothetical protein
MPVPTPAGPNPADPGAISNALDEMEERVVGRRVDPPRSNNLGDQEDSFDAQNGAGEHPAGTEPTA